MKDFFNFIYLENKNFIFVYNPKVACTNWKCLLRYMMGYSDNYLDASIAHDRNRSGLSFLSDITEPLAILASKSIKKYSFVRNPYSRILSAYLNKIEPYAEGLRGQYDDNTYFYHVYKEIDMYRSRNLPDEKVVNFYCFLHWISNVSDLHAKNEHWLPQAELLRIDEVQYDFIGRFESLDEDSKILLKMMQCDAEFPSQNKVKFAPTNANQKIGKYYGGREVELMDTIYRQDFEKLGYKVGDVFK